jgi:hypothetical protein
MRYLRRLIGDLDEAIRWCAMVPSARFGAIEIRSVMAMNG